MRSLARKRGWCCCSALPTRRAAGLTTRCRDMRARTTGTHGYGASWVSLLSIARGTDGSLCCDR